MVQAGRHFTPATTEHDTNVHTGRLGPGCPGDLSSATGAASRLPGDRPPRLSVPVQSHHLTQPCRQLAFCEHVPVQQEQQQDADPCHSQTPQRADALHQDPPRRALSSASTKSQRPEWSRRGETRPRWHLPVITKLETKTSTQNSLSRCFKFPESRSLPSAPGTFLKSTAPLCKSTHTRTS